MREILLCLGFRKTECKYVFRMDVLIGNGGCRESVSQNLVKSIV
jgi:hypothetical protein